jgi:ankyrin repeat protein
MDYSSTIAAIHQNLSETSPEHARIFRFVLLSHHDPHTFCADEHGRTPLHYAAAMDVSNVLESYLQSNRYNVNWADHLGQTALHTALSRFPLSSDDQDYQQTAHQLLVHGADPNYSPFGPTPLMLAVLKEDYETVRMLLKAGADPNQRYDADGALFKRGDTALSLAVRLNTLCSATPTPFTLPQTKIIGRLIKSAKLTPNTMFHALQQTKNRTLKEFMMKCAGLPKI